MDGRLKPRLSDSITMKARYIFLGLFIFGLAVAPLENILFGYPTLNYIVQNTVEIIIFIGGFAVGKMIGW